MKQKLFDLGTNLIVSVDDLKTHLFLFDDDSYDAELQSIIESAQTYVSDVLGRAVTDAGYEVSFCSFYSEFALAHCDVATDGVESLKYYDTDRTLQTVSPANYFVDNSGDVAKLKLEPGYTIPAQSNLIDFPVVIRYRTTPAVLPQSVNHAVLIVASELFNVRSETVEVKRNKGMDVATTLLMNHRKWG